MKFNYGRLHGVVMSRDMTSRNTSSRSKPLLVAASWRALFAYAVALLILTTIAWLQGDWFISRYITRGNNVCVDISGHFVGTHRLEMDAVGLTDGQRQIGAVAYTALAL